MADISGLGDLAGRINSCVECDIVETGPWIVDQTPNTPHMV